MNRGQRLQDSRVLASINRSGLVAVTPRSPPQSRSTCPAVHPQARGAPSLLEQPVPCQGAVLTSRAQEPECTAS